MTILTHLTRRRHPRRPCFACHDSGRMWNPPVGAIACPLCPARKSHRWWSL
ncbi:hypothetical protein [Actinomadura hibisca]|uniref:hypothetical protein n=1 Tax=Actinomadura hibisca TaxID=68565 RepID=UPI000A69B7DF|nr:hypothetical protein [Actinomadura hibisca]